MASRSAKPITVTLGPLADAAARRVEAGGYASVSEVVRAGLRALDREDAALDQILKARVTEALTDARPTIGHDEVFRDLRKRHEARVARDA